MSENNITINDIRDAIKANLNKKVAVEAHRTKKKIYTKRGTIREAYSNIFIVESDEIAGTDTRLSFTYADLLTKNVQILLEDESGELTDLVIEN